MRPTPVISLGPTAALELVPCKFSLEKDKYCQKGAYHITNPVTLGDTVTLTFTVRNVGDATSGPLVAVMIGCTRMSGCDHSPFFLPDRFTLRSCAPRCRAQVVNDRTTWEMQWLGKIPPRETVDLTVKFRADRVGYQYISMALYEESLDEYNKNLLDPSRAADNKLGEWPAAQVVVDPR